MASGTKKLLIGCAIGCGGIVLIGIILVAGFSYWITQPGELMEPARLLGADTTGYAEWTLRSEDPGTERFVEALVDLSGRTQTATTPFPPELERYLKGWQDGRNRKNLKLLFPLVAAWTLRPGDADGRDHHLFSASLKMLGNKMVLVDWMLGWSFVRGDGGEFRKIPYRDDRIYQLHLDSGAEPTFFIRGNDMFFTLDLKTAQQAIDRMADPAPPQREPTPLDGLFAGAPADRPLRAALTNGRGEIFRLWRKVAVAVPDARAVEEITGQLGGAILSGGLTGEGSMEGRIELIAPDATWAAAHREEALAAFQAGLGYEGLKVAATAGSEAERIRIDFRLDDIPAFLGRMVDRLGEKIEDTARRIGSEPGDQGAQ